RAFVGLAKAEAVACFGQDVQRRRDSLLFQGFVVRRQRRALFVVLAVTDKSGRKVLGDLGASDAERPRINERLKAWPGAFSFNRVRGILLAFFPLFVLGCQVSRQFT